MLSRAPSNSCHSKRIVSESTDKGTTMKRYGMVIGLAPDKVDEYQKLHAAAWPDVLTMIRKCHIRNYSIYLRTLEDGRPYLFSYFEYIGSDFSADMAQMAADPTTQRWWSFCHLARCHSPTAPTANGGLAWKRCSTRTELVINAASGRVRRPRRPVRRSVRFRDGRCGPPRACT